MRDGGCRRSPRVRTASFQIEWRRCTRLRIQTWIDPLSTIRTDVTTTRIRLAARVARILVGTTEETHASLIPTTGVEVTIPAETSRNAAANRTSTGGEGMIRQHRKTPEPGPIRTTGTEATIPAETSRNAAGDRTSTEDEGMIRQHRKTPEPGPIRTTGTEATIRDERRR